MKIPPLLLILSCLSQSRDDVWALTFGAIGCRQRGICQSLAMTMTTDVEETSGNQLSRREMVKNSLVAAVSGIVATSAPLSALAAERPPLDSLLYKILRVREATQQETRLITTGKFKDVQRANVKLAVKFMLENYRLQDAFVAASGYLDGNQRRVEAGQVGQAAVQNLYTILEYFDASDVQNIKVGGDGMGGKQDLVLKGLEATKTSIDEFLSYFPKDVVDTVRLKVQEENELNKKEFDASLGAILNLPTTSDK